MVSSEKTPENTAIADRHAGCMYSQGTSKMEFIQ